MKVDAWSAHDACGTSDDHPDDRPIKKLLTFNKSGVQSDFMSGLDELFVHPLSWRDHAIAVGVDLLEFFKFVLSPARGELAHLQLTISVSIVLNKIVIEPHVFKLGLDGGSLVNGALFR